MNRRRLYGQVVPTQYVDLGLSVNWATGNIVKNGNTYSIGEPTDVGAYYSWGNIDGHNKEEGYNFDDSTYNSTAGSSLSANIASNDSAHDAALACLGSPWRLPTKEECDELVNNCTVTFVTSYNGVNIAGSVFRSNKPGYTNAEIFMPVTGRYVETTLYWGDSEGYYWTSTYSKDNYRLAASFFFNNRRAFTNYPNRYVGQSIRAVQSVE